MIDKELFYKIASHNFNVFQVADEEDINILFSLYPDKEKIREQIKAKMGLTELKLPQRVYVELYVLLTEFAVTNNVTPFETCAFFRVIFDVLEMIKLHYDKVRIYEKFKKSVLTFAMNRFFYQIGILEKDTVYLITNFFIDVIYKRFHLISYCLTEKQNIDLNTRELLQYTLPQVENLENAHEILPRNAKILRQYFESRRPKTELEQKIEMILEFERERLDAKMEEVFEEQDIVFNKKADELLKKKK